MSDDATGAGAQLGVTADAIAHVCGHEPDIRALLGRHGDTSTLDRLLHVLRDCGAVSEPLDELHAVLQRAGDALGVYGHTRGDGDRAVRHTGLGSPQRVEVVFVCRAGRCSRFWSPNPVILPPVPPYCAIDGEPLAWQRLR